MKKLQIFNALLLLSVIASALYFYPVLPAKIPTHWNINGVIDQYTPKETAIWLMPGIILLMFLGFRFMPLLDPNKNKYRLFQTEWQIIQSALIGFFSYMHFITISASLNPALNIMPYMFMGMGSLFILLGNYLSKIRQNYFLGIRVPWTLSNEDNWNKTHRYASWTFVLAGIVTLVEAVLIWNAAPVIFAGLSLAAMLPVLYSFLLFKKKAHLMKYLHVGLALLIASLFAVRLMSTEDDWICRNGKWIPHGNPSAAAPKSICR